VVANEERKQKKEHTHVHNTDKHADQNMLFGVMAYFMRQYGNQFINRMTFDQCIKEGDPLSFSESGKKAFALEERFEPSIT